MLFMIRVLLIMLLTFTLSKSGYAQVRKAPKPNIIYILADDAGYGDFGCYGQKEILTPNVDNMASEGMMFTNHYAGAPVCAPSRCSLLTGMHTGHSYVRGNIEKLPEGQLPLKEGIPTIADMLKTQGYSCAVIGKWGLGGPGTAGIPSKHGFDYFYGYLCQRQAHDYYPQYLWKNEEKIKLDGKEYSHDLFTKEALQFIESHLKVPFFLYLAYTIPHANLQVPDLGLYKDKDWPINKKRYAAMISRMDNDIGTILRTLKELGIANNTIVMFSSDNGPHAEGGYDPGYFHSSGPFRGKKRDVYEGGIRVPMIAWWPGTIPSATVSNHVSAFWDIMPTLAEIAGCDIPVGIDGISMYNELLGNFSKQQKHDYLYWEFHEQGGKQALLKGTWKAVHLNVRLFPDRDGELYNLHNDPYETHDVAKEYPQVASDMSAMMKQVRTESDVFPLVGRMVYGFGLFNAWLVSIVYAALSFLLFIFARPANRKEMIAVYSTHGKKGWAMVSIRALTVCLLFGISVVSPLWFGTAWMDTGLIVSIAGVAGFAVSYGYRVFRKTNTPPVHGPFRISKMADSIFSCIFWLGVAIISVSWLMLLFVIVFGITACYTHRLREDYYVKKYAGMA